VPLGYKVAVLSDQIKPFILGTLSTLAHFRHSTGNRTESEMMA
jgi:hypothetical protein